MSLSAMSAVLVDPERDFSLCSFRTDCRARIFEIRPQSHSVTSDVTLPYHPWATRRAAVVMHGATFTSNARKMLLRPILKNGTIRTAIKNCIRNESVRLPTSGFVT